MGVGGWCSLYSLFWIFFNFAKPLNEWYKLSSDCVHSSSINMFKNGMDNYLVRADYT